MSRLCPLLPSGEVSCSYTHTQKKWIKEKQSHVGEAAGSSHLPPLGRLCQQEGNTSSSGNQHFMWTAQFPAIKPPDQPSHFWAAQHFSLWPRPKASLYPENSYEEDYTNFPWLFFFQDLKPKQYLNILLPMVSMSEWMLRLFYRMGI